MQHITLLNNKLNELNKEIYNIRYPVIDGICYKLDDETNTYHITDILNNKVTIPDEIYDTKISKIYKLSKKPIEITFTNQIEVDPNLNESGCIQKIIGLSPTIKLNYPISEVEYLNANFKLTQLPVAHYSVTNFGCSPYEIPSSIFGFTVNDICVAEYKDEDKLEITIPSSIVSCKMKDPARPCKIYNNSKLALDPECVSNDLDVVNIYDFDKYTITTTISKVNKPNIIDDINSC